MYLSISEIFYQIYRPCLTQSHITFYTLFRTAGGQKTIACPAVRPRVEQIFFLRPPINVFSTKNESSCLNNSKIGWIQTNSLLL